MKNEPTNIRAALFDELDAPGSITKARIRNLLIRYPEDGPRTITTEEEVEALTQGTRLYSTKTRDFWILNDLSQHGGVRVHGTGGGYTFLHDFIRQQAPLIIMHEPEPTP